MVFDKCKHCGTCCLSGVPCGFGQVWFNITEKKPRPCPACEFDGELYWCSLVKYPLKWFGSMFDNIKWKCDFMADLVKLYNGMGKGCGYSLEGIDAAKQINTLLRMKLNTDETSIKDDMNENRVLNPKSQRQS